MKYYKIILSSKHEILIDEDDYTKFLTVSGTGNFIKLKGAVVNPSFVVGIIPSKEKLEPEKTMTGYLDEESRTFVITGEGEKPLLPDEFTSSTKQLADKFKI